MKAKTMRRIYLREAAVMLVLAGLESVSVLTLFEESTPCSLIERCRPDISQQDGVAL